MTDKQIINKCGFCDDDKYCRVYPYTCDFDYYCNDNEDCPVKNILSELQAKEQECEELKKQHQADKGLITSTGKMNYQLIQEYDKLKTALTEIKEIIHFNKTNRLSGGADISIEQILQKISEVEDG